MFGFATTRIRPLSEEFFTEIVELAGGRRAYPDHDRQTRRNADYILGEAVIELKVLDDEGLSKAERQAKLARLFSASDPERPVHVLDRNLLCQQGRRAYDRAMEGPIKGAVRSAKAQLIQSRADFPETKQSVLMLVNNGNTSLDHDEIVEMVGRRARNDTDEIDGVVIAGAYLHSDGFDTFALWPINYVPIHLDRAFREFDALRNSFHVHAERAMTAAIVNGPSDEMTKGPILDISFDAGGKTFVKPAPPLGKGSDFYVNGRPRLNSTGIEHSPIVGLTFPELSRSEWQKFRAYMPDEHALGERFDDWLLKRENAVSEGTSLRPMVPITVTLDGWLKSMNCADPLRYFDPVRTYANTLYQEAITRIIDGAQNLAATKIVPSRYVLTVTEQIGQDEANDVSHIFLIEETPGHKPRTRVLVENARTFHRHAVTLGASYAVKHGVSSLRWKCDLTYAWS